MQDWGVPLAVFGMLLATLFMAALLNRYQTYQVAVRARLRRLESGIGELQNALGELRGVPLSRELRVTLRGDLIARLHKIRRLYRRYPAIAERLRAAETALNGEGPPSPGGVGPIDDEQAFRRIVGSLDGLIRVMDQGDTIRPIPRDVRTIFRRELGERRAEVMSRYHLVESRRLETAGKMTAARAHLTTLLQVLRRRGPSTDFVRELYAEAESALSALGSREIDGGEPAAAGTGSEIRRRIA